MEEGERAHLDAAQRDTFVDERGVVLTRAGMVRAGERLAESRSRHTSEYFAALRDRLGIAPGANP
jgi:hypothetical protein